MTTMLDRTATLDLCPYTSRRELVLDKILSLKLGLAVLATTAAVGCATPSDDPSAVELSNADTKDVSSAADIQKVDPPPPIVVAFEPPGANCAYGGVSVTDASGTQYACNGAPGPAGADGADGVNGTNGTNGTNGVDGIDGTSVTVTAVAAGASCTYGGVAVTDASGTQYICNGAPGADGAAGANGADGADGVSVSVAAEAAGSNCANGGVAVSGANGTQYVCNGTDADPSAIEVLEARILELERLHYKTRVFVTSSKYSPNFGGIAGGDAICQSHADAAGLGGTWLAWLSDSTGTPTDNFSQSPYNYVLVDDTVIAESWDDLTDGALDHLISLDENGTSQTGYVWTATTSAGALTSNTCSDWTTTSGYGKVGSANDDNSGANPNWWTTRGNTGCGGTARLYCFEQ